MNGLYLLSVGETHVPLEVNKPRTFFDYLLEPIKYAEAVVQRCSVKKLFQEILQISQETNCAWVYFLIELLGWGLQLLKKRRWRRCFPVNFVKFLRTLFFIKHLWWLLLNMSFYLEKCCQAVWLTICTKIGSQG